MQLKSHNRFHLRLDTLLLLVTLAVVFVAYFKARSTRQDWQLRLNRLETASGLPFIADITQAEVSSVRSLATRQNPIWYIWIPYGQSASICLATTGFDQEFPSRCDTFKLGPGRHRLMLDRKSSNSKTKISLDDQIIWERAADSRWNLAFPWTYSLSSKGNSFPKSPETLFYARGNLRLRANEEFRPEMLDFGLKIWLAK
jgi:hypothetical protein